MPGHPLQEARTPSQGSPHATFQEGGSSASGTNDVDEPMADKELLEGGTKQKAFTDTEFSSQGTPQAKKPALALDGRGSVWSAGPEHCELSDDDSFNDQRTDPAQDGGEL